MDVFLPGQVEVHFTLTWNVDAQCQRTGNIGVGQGAGLPRQVVGIADQLAGQACQPAFEHSKGQHLARLSGMEVDGAEVEMCAIYQELLDQPGAQGWPMVRHALGRLQPGLRLSKRWAMPSSTCIETCA